jgi:hypothetical protein
VNSIVMRTVEQGQLPLSRRAGRVAIPHEIIVAQPSLLAAVNLCISASGLEDKEIYLSLEIDAGHFSKIRKGDAHFPTDKLDALCDLCGNEAPLQWWANKRGYGLVMLKSESERLLAARDEEIEMLKLRLEHYQDFARLNK